MKGELIFLKFTKDPRDLINGAESEVQMIFIREKRMVISIVENGHEILVANTFDFLTDAHIKKSSREPVIVDIPEGLVERAEAFIKLRHEFEGKLRNFWNSNVTWRSEPITS